jgi:small GTP-binding protein
MPGFKHIKIKICLLGDPAVGKTSLIQQYIYNFFGDTYMRTLGTKVSRKVVQVEDTENDMEYELTMMIWDIMGQKFTSMPLDKYLKMAQGALIVCDITREETFKSLAEWKKTLYKQSGKIPVVYLANKIDLEKNAAFKLSVFEDFCNNENIEYFVSSAKTGKNVNEAFFKLGESIVKFQAKGKVKVSRKTKVVEEPKKVPKLETPIPVQGGVLVSGRKVENVENAKTDEISVNSLDSGPADNAVVTTTPKAEEPVTCEKL